VIASRVPAIAPDVQPLDRSRARLPDESGRIERDGVGVAWDRYGSGGPTILLLPTWSIVHARHWKLQVPYLARHFRVLTFDGRGNGRSDRPQDPASYADTEFVADAVAVLDATGTRRAVLAGLSMGGGYALRLAAEHPDRVMGAVYIGPAVPVLDRVPQEERARHGDDFEDPLPTDDGWARYNAHYWRRDWPGFAEFFAARVFSERHSTKHREDFVGWMLETDPETIIATERASGFALPPGWSPGPPNEGAAVPFARRIRCPGLVIQGDADEVLPHAIGARLAALLGAPLVTIAGGGHAPQGREPVLVNRLIADFTRRVAAGERIR
jgi:pimeloyl-ACP methyl ester carboxylesterase